MITVSDIYGVSEMFEEDDYFFVIDINHKSILPGAQQEQMEWFHDLYDQIFQHKENSMVPLGANASLSDITSLSFYRDFDYISQLEEISFYVNLQSKQVSNRSIISLWDTNKMNGSIEDVYASYSNKREDDFFMSLIELAPVHSVLDYEPRDTLGRLNRESHLRRQELVRFLASLIQFVAATAEESSEPLVKVKSDHQAKKALLIRILSNYFEDFKAIKTMRRVLSAFMPILDFFCFLPILLPPADRSFYASYRSTRRHLLNILLFLFFQFPALIVIMEFRNDAALDLVKFFENEVPTLSVQVGFVKHQLSAVCAIQIARVCGIILIPIVIFFSGRQTPYELDAVN